MSITIEMTDQEISEIKHLTQLENDAEAITRAAREFLDGKGCRDPLSPITR